MKKVLACVYSLVLLLMLLSGCLLNPDRDGIDVSPSSSGQNDTPNTSGDVDSTSEAVSSNEASIERGTWNGDIYTNDFSGIKFTLPNGWVSATAEEIAQLIGVSEDILKDDQKWMIDSAKLTTIYDMYAHDPNTGNNVFVLFTNLTMSAGGTELTEKDVLETAKQQLTALENIEYTFGDYFNAEIGGKEYLAMKGLEEVKGYDQYYFIRRQDDHMIGIIATFFDEADIDSILTQFK
jgi:hypothetical protein